MQVTGFCKTDLYDNKLTRAWEWNKIPETCGAKLNLIVSTQDKERGIYLMPRDGRAGEKLPWKRAFLGIISRHTKRICQITPESRGAQRLAWLVGMREIFQLHSDFHHFSPRAHKIGAWSVARPTLPGLEFCFHTWSPLTPPQVGQGPSFSPKCFYLTLT